LIEQIGAGNRIAAFEFVRRYEAPVILPVASRILGNAADAEEVRSQVLLRLLNIAAEALLPDQGAAWRPEKPKAWLRATTSRSAIDLKRSRDAERARRKLQVDWLQPPCTPLDEAEEVELSGHVHEALAEVPPLEREALDLLVLQGLSAEAACQEAGVSRRTLYRRRASALERLRAMEKLRVLYDGVA
jgi:RNA polymerase sigma-70 factor (ECF subfamily)